MYEINFHTKEELYKFAEEKLLSEEKIKILEMRCKEVSVSIQCEELHMSRATYFRKVKSIFVKYNCWR